MFFEKRIISKKKYKREETKMNTEKLKKKRLTKKQEALRLLKKLDCSYEIIPGSGWDNSRRIEVFPPQGMSFEGTLSSYTCYDWIDVIIRVSCPDIIEEWKD